MERVLDYRLATGRVQPCATCVGAVALMACDRLGGLVWLDFNDGTGPEGPYLVTDCGAEKDRAGLRKRNRVAEVDWPTALRHRMTGPVPVRVLVRVPEICPVRGAC